MNLVSPKQVFAAKTILAGVAHKTPVLTSASLDRISRASVRLKCENFQRTGSFKFRGAYNAVFLRKARGHRGAIATVSSGNHAQGIALASQLMGYETLVVMPKPFAEAKYRATRSYGATVTVAETRASAEEMLSRLASELGAAFVHPFNDPDVIAGQGTILLELREQCPDTEILLAPVGGGGLLSGLCAASQGFNTGLKIYACEPAGALDAMHSVAENRIVGMPSPSTVADGLRTSLGTLTLPILRKHLAGFFVVTEEEIASAVRFAFERLKLVIEPSSAVALAPLLRQESDLVGTRIAVILTGGNVDQTMFCGLVAAANPVDRPRVRNPNAHTTELP